MFRLPFNDFCDIFPSRKCYAERYYCCDDHVIVSDGIQDFKATIRLENGRRRYFKWI